MINKYYLTLTRDYRVGGAGGVKGLSPHLPPISNQKYIK